jgi:hypothetical protein
MRRLLGTHLAWSAVAMLAGALMFPGVGRAQTTPEWATPPALAPGSDVTLYEASEDMRLAGKKLVHRKATSSLMCVARPGTPLCPSTSTGVCTVNALGSDNVDVATGLGSVSGTFTVVTQGDNPTDSPELTVLKGTFSGDMDFSPALVHGVPYGTVTGKMNLDGKGGKVAFTGTFRLPVNPPVFDLACLASHSDPLACVTGYGSPSYLTNPAAFPFGWTAVAPNEYALGWPTVRFEIKF